MLARRARFAVSVALAVAAVSTTTSIARANIVGCVIDPVDLTCGFAGHCMNDAQCYEADHVSRCFQTDVGTPGICAPNCNALFACNGDGDCPDFVGLNRSCRMVSTPLGTASGICQYTAPPGRMAVGICGDAASWITACFTPTGSWADGDCDRDGHLNGVDPHPCIMDSSTVPDLLPVPNPFCLPGPICEGTTDACHPVLRCDPSPSSFDCTTLGVAAPWVCSTTLHSTDTAICHPPCDATLDCSESRTCGIGATFVACTDITGGPMGTLSRCELTCTCASPDPIDAASLDGDCDLDGAPNRCDPTPCVHHTTDTGGGACTPSLACLPPPDAGIPDASVVLDGGNASDGGAGVDAGSDDAGSIDDAGTDDAGAVDDGGGSALDASTLPARLPSFAGGGGCRCGAASPSPPSRGAWLSLVGLALVVVGRRAARRR
jgi:hypothetical protein